MVLLQHDFVKFTSMFIKLHEFNTDLTVETLKEQIILRYAESRATRFLEVIEYDIHT